MVDQHTKQRTQDLLEVEDLSTHFFTPEGIVRAVDGVDLRMKQGRILGIVGESGCGKTVLALTIMRLIPDPPGKIVTGHVFFQGVDLTTLDAQEMRSIRGNKISMIFQEPMSSLNPVFTIGSQIAEVFLLHQKDEASNKSRALEMSIEMLKRVGIENPEKRIKDYPHQLSGGMCQRIMIAMALACKPELMIADEPTTALDVTTQAQILDLMIALQQDSGTSIILVTHDLGVVAQTCQDVAVMYTGKVVEFAGVSDIFSQPLHPYTKGLMKSIPKVGAGLTGKKLLAISGNVPTFKNMPDGCTFHDRCPEVMEKCYLQAPPMFRPEKGHCVRCWRHEG
ncbi:MAG: ABC transporter ATP-binding protein [Deltaproteobacteria bacterium]|nr:ABC transporter ATP-binding protein [Deltaproteobacteria bacterium]